MSFHQWDAIRDNLLVYAITCPDGGGMLVQIYDPFELYDSISLYRKELLSPEEMQYLREFLQKTNGKACDRAQPAAGL